MEDFAVAESPAIDSAVDSSTPVDSAPVDSEVSGTQETESSESEAPDTPPEAPDAKDFRAVVDGRLSATAKAALDKLKTENPTLAKTMQRALFAEDRLRRELPGGFKEIADWRSKIEQLGGDDGIKEVQNEIGGWREFDSLYTSGDPKVLEFLTQEPEAKDAFLKIAPGAFEKFRELNPDGYAAYVSQVFTADMMNARVPLMLERLQDFVADNPKAQEVLGQLIGYVNRIGKFAENPVNVPSAAKQPQAVDPRTAELDQREQQFTRKEWGNETATKHSQMFNSAWKSIVGDRKLSDTQLGVVKELYGLRLKAILDAQPDFQKNLEKYFTAKQKDGFVRHFESVYKEAVPNALRKAIEQAGVGAKPGPRPGSSGAKPAGVTPKADAGFQIGAKPSMDEVNRKATTPEMWASRKAILKNGTMRQWTK